MEAKQETLINCWALIKILLIGINSWSFNLLLPPTWLQSFFLCTNWIAVCKKIHGGGKGGILLFFDKWTTTSVIRTTFVGIRLRILNKNKLIYFNNKISFVKIQIVLFKYDCFVLFTVFSEFVGFNFKKCKCFQKLFQFFLVEIFWSDPDPVQAIWSDPTKKGSDLTGSVSAKL